VLAAPALHAGWNALLKGTGDRLATVVLLDLTGTVAGYVAWLFLLHGLPIPLVALAVRGRRRVLAAALLAAGIVALNAPR
jgi:hypothetical protein